MCRDEQRQHGQQTEYQPKCLEDSTLMRETGKKRKPSLYSCFIHLCSPLVIKKICIRNLTFKSTLRIFEVCLAKKKTRYAHSTNPLNTYHQNILLYLLILEGKEITFDSQKTLEV